MRILFTGGSSFTGYWFVRGLAARGHHVWATLRGTQEDYAERAWRRVEGLESLSSIVPSAAFGSAAFRKAMSERGPFDLLCHHGAEVANYQSIEFDVAAAFDSNTLNARETLSEFKAQGGKGILLTGSVFEGGEGAGSDGLPAFSPYGLSKELTWLALRYHALNSGLAVGKFVIPNPFGPLEEPRFTHYLMRTWFQHKIAEVRTPAYVRDNIHVGLLTDAYVDFAQHIAQASGESRLNPSGYIGRQGDFAHRFAAEMRSRLPLECDLKLLEQSDFSEPRIRINTDPVTAAASDWSESGAWDELASYYSNLFSPSAPARG